MIRNLTHNTIFSSLTAPSPEVISYWVDISEDVFGKTIKCWNGVTKVWEPILLGPKGDTGDKFRYEDFTDEQILELQKPAIDAAEHAYETVGTLRDVANVLTSYEDRLAWVEKYKIDGGYSDDGILYLTSQGIEIIDPIPVGSGSGGGGGVGSVFRIINLGSSSVGVAKGQPVTLTYSFTSTDYDTGEPTGNGTATYYVNEVRVATQIISQGTVTFSIGTYLAEGINTVRVQAVDSYGNTKSISIEVQVISLTISSTFDSSVAYTSDIDFPYTPTGTGTKTVHFILDGVALESVETTASNRQLYYRLSNLSHGSHVLEVYSTMNYEGVDIESNHLTYSIIYLSSSSTEPIIASSFSRTTAEQYEILAIPFTVYNPQASTSSVILKANDVTISTQTVDRTTQTWSYRIPIYGSLKLEIISGTASKVFNLTVEKSSISSEAETENLELLLMADGRSNNESNPGTWVYNNISSTFTGFNYVTNGWVLDDDNVTALRISSGASVSIPFKPFATDFKAAGKTIEFEFKVSDVENFSATVIDCYSNGIGFKVSVQDILYQSELTSVSTKFKEDELIRVSIVVESRLRNRLIWTYLNGIASGVIQYPTNDNFSQNPAVNITLGSPECTLDVYTIRSYSAGLNSYQVLNNYIADTASVTKKLAIYDRNQIYDSTGEIVYGLLVNQLPCMTIIGDLPTYKGDKKTVAMTYENLQDSSKSFTASGVQIDVQGTSSQYYPRKNFKHSFKNGLTYNNTGESATTYALFDESIPVDTFCEKADFAESSGTHNTGMAKYVDSMLKKLNYLTPPQKTDSRVRTTVDGYPIAIFHKATESSPSTFVGKYNFNNDKSTQNTFGLSGTNECWEFLNNTSDRSLFRSADFTGTDWLNDFEGRYPDGHTDPSNLKVLFDWVLACIGNPSKFKLEASEHFDINNLLSYYLITEFFGMVDQRAKNQFLTSWGNEGSGNYKWRFIFYDNDTVLGINNEGENEFSYNIEDQDIHGSGHIWNGWDSELWKLVAAAYPDEIASMYATMRQTGALTYDGTLSILNGEQSDKWCEVVYNMDGQYKYVEPLIESGNATYLYALQGSREDHRIWWLSNRFNYMDSKYNTGDFLSDYVTMRVYTPTTWTGVAPNADFDLTLYKHSYVRVKYGSYNLYQRAEQGDTVHITAPAIQFNDTETIVYGVSSIKGIGDLSSKYPGTVDISNAKKLTELIIGSSVTGYSNANLRSVSIGNNNLLKTINVVNCPSLTGALEASGCTNIEEIFAKGSSITSVNLPSAGILKTLSLPGTIANLTIKNQPNLTDTGLSIESKTNISTLVLENMNSIDIQSLVLELLGISVLKLNRVRLIGVDFRRSDLSLLISLSKIKGLDQLGNDTDVAIVTGKYHATGVGESELAECIALFPELIITYDIVFPDPITTFIFSSSQGKVISNSTFECNLKYTKLTETTYYVSAAAGVTIEFTFNAENHESVSRFVIVTTARTISYSAIYIPLRTIIFKNAQTSLPIIGETAIVDSVKYVTDYDGAIYLRTLNSFVGTMSVSNYGECTFSAQSSTIDTTQTVLVYPYVSVKFTVKESVLGAPISGAAITISETTLITDENGVATFSLPRGTYSYTVMYKVGSQISGQVYVESNDISFSVIIDGTIDDSKPDPNGNIQLRTATRYSYTVRYYITTSDSVNNWVLVTADGESYTGEDATAIAEAENMVRVTHIPSVAGQELNIEVLNNVNITSIGVEMNSGASTIYSYLTLTAFWSIGNSAIKNMTMKDQQSILYVGGDIFKNDIDRTDLSGAFMNCYKLIDIGDDVFLPFASGKITNISSLFYRAYALKSLPNLSYLSSASRLDNAFIETSNLSPSDIDISSFNNISNLGSTFYRCGSALPLSSSVRIKKSFWSPSNSTILSSAAQTNMMFYESCVKSIYLPKWIMAIGANSLYTRTYLEYLELESPNPPELNSGNGLRDATKIYVPDESVSLYKEAPVWLNYASNIFPISEKPVDVD